MNNVILKPFIGQIMETGAIFLTIKHLILYYLHNVSQWPMTVLKLDQWNYSIWENSEAYCLIVEPIFRCPRSNRNEQIKKADANNVKK